MFTRRLKEDQVMVRPKIECGPGLTKQSMKDDTDINLILAKFRKTGTLNFVNNNEGEYMDVPEIDFHTAMNVITEANQMFEQMPSHLRKEFKNDPGEFMDVMHDPEQRERVYDLGLAKRPEVEAEAKPEAPTEGVPTPSE